MIGFFARDVASSDFFLIQGLSSSNFGVFRDADDCFSSEGFKIFRNNRTRDVSDGEAG